MPSKTKLHFCHAVITKSPSLLPMLYTPAELSEELGVPAKQFRAWAKLGMPCSHDRQGHLFVNGEALASLIKANHKKGSRERLKAGEAYCLRCNKAVPMKVLTERTNGNQVLSSGTCPLCGNKINRGGKRNDPPSQLPSSEPFSESPSQR